MRLALPTALAFALLFAATGSGVAQPAADLERAQQLNRDAVAMFRERRFAEALPRAEEALAIREKTLGPDDLDVATSLYNVASMCEVMGQLPRAEQLLTRAAAIRERRSGPDDLDLASALGTLADVLREEGAYARAEASYQRALAIREKRLGPEHAEVGVTLNNMGLLYLTTGDGKRAEQLFTRALGIQEKLGGPDSPDVASILDNLAQVFDARGDAGRADPLYERALRIRERALGPDHPALAQSLNNYGRALMQRGDLTRAGPMFERAAAIFEKTFGPDSRDLAAALNNVGELYRERADFARAEPAYRRALAILEKTEGREHADVGLLANNLGLLVMMKGDLAEAEPLLRRALTVFEKSLGPSHRLVGNAASNLGELLQARGDFDQAEAAFRRAIEVFTSALGPDHPDTAQAVANLALLRGDAGDVAKAAELTEKSIAVYERALGKYHPRLGFALDNLALFRARQGDTAAAVRLLARGQEIREHDLELVLAIGSEAQKRAFMATNEGDTSGVVSLHVRYAPKSPEAARLALETVLRRKGRVLDAVSDGMAALRRRLGAGDRALLDQLDGVRAKLATLALRGPGEEEPSRHQANVDALEREAARLESEVSGRSAELRVRALPVTLASVQAKIPDAAALVEIVEWDPIDLASRGPKERWGPPRYVAYVLRARGDPGWVDLGEAAPLDAAVEALRRALSTPGSDADAPARALDERLMRPLEPLLGDARHILVSPDGALNLVPFGALVDGSGRYRIQRFAISYLTTGRDLLRLEAAGTSRQGALVVADPSFDDGGDPAGASAASPVRGLGGARFTPLPGTAAEAKAIAALWPGALALTGARATEAAIKRATGPRILHVATHGFFLAAGARAAPQSRGFELAGSVGSRMPDNPLLRSGLALAGANPRRSGDQDGILTALEASGLDLGGTRLVVLSACETGVGEVQAGDGVYGLRRALVIAGAESQIMSLWKVDDDATRELMVAFYEGLRAGHGRAAALREAQLGVMEKRRHPYYWAAFIPSGAWTPIDDAAVPPAVEPSARGCACESASRPPAPPAVALAVLAAVLALGRRRRL